MVSLIKSTDSGYWNNRQNILLQILKKTRKVDIGNNTFERGKRYEIYAQRQRVWYIYNAHTTQQRKYLTYVRFTVQLVEFILMTMFISSLVEMSVKYHQRVKYHQS